MPHREVALIFAADDRPPSRQFVGLPEAIDSAGEGRRALAWPRVAVIFERPDGIFLERFTGVGEPVGDTWHMSVAEAKEQATKEYGRLLGPWHVVPGEVDDEAIVEYARTELE